MQSDVLLSGCPALDMALRNVQPVVAIDIAIESLSNVPKLLGEEWKTRPTSNVHGIEMEMCKNV